MTIPIFTLQEGLAGATSQQGEDAGQKAKSAAGHVNGALTDTDMAPSKSSSGVQQVDGTSPAPQQRQQQQTEGVSALPQEQQQQQDSKGGMHLSELRYELGPELKQVSRVLLLVRRSNHNFSHHHSLPALSASD